MADKSERADVKLWRQLATKDGKGADPDGLVWHTPEGLDVKPLWTADDVRDLDFADRGGWPSSRSSVAPPCLGCGLAVVTVDAQRLTVGWLIQSTSPERDDMVTHRGHLDMTPSTEGLRASELVAPLLQASARRARHT